MVATMEATQTPIFDAVVEAEGYTPGEVKFRTHREFMAHANRLHRIARKKTEANKKAPAKKAAAKKAPAKKATTKKAQPKKG